MEAKIQDNSSEKDEKIAGKDGNHHDKSTEDSSFDGSKESRITQFNNISNVNSENKGFADRANNIGTLNEDKSTISDTSAPSASMQDKDTE